MYVMEMQYCVFFEVHTELLNYYFNEFQVQTVKEPRDVRSGFFSLIILHTKYTQGNLKRIIASSQHRKR
jgi:hypothetical protein